MEKPKIVRDVVIEMDKLLLGDKFSPNDLVIYAIKNPKHLAVYEESLSMRLDCIKELRKEIDEANKAIV